MYFLSFSARRLFAPFVRVRSTSLIHGGENRDRSVVLNVTVIFLLVKRHPYIPFQLLGPVAGLYAYIENVCKRRR